MRPGPVRRHERAGATPGRVATLALWAAMAATASAAAGAASTGGSTHASRSPPPVDAPVAATAIVDSTPRGGRPFEHRRHERVSCRACHGAGERHRTLFVRTARDCASCHHDARRGMSCGACHAPGELAAATMVAARLTLTVRDSSTVRPLPFRHTVHVAAGKLACTTCHATPVTLARNRECASCHADHHLAAADCSSCHAAPRAGAHDARAHLSCTGAGCHAASVAPPPTLSRSLCLTCHVAQRDHERGGSCAACHRVPDATRHVASTGARTVAEIAP